MNSSAKKYFPPVPHEPNVLRKKKMHEFQHNAVTRSLNVTVPVLNSRGRCSMVVYLSTRTEWRSAERGYSPYVKNHSKPPSLTHGDSDDGKMDRSVSISKMYASVWSYKCLGYRKTKRTYVELCLFTLHT